MIGPPEKNTVIQVCKNIGKRLGAIKYPTLSHFRELRVIDFLVTGIATLRLRECHIVEWSLGMLAPNASESPIWTMYMACKPIGKDFRVSAICSDLEATVMSQDPQGHSPRQNWMSCMSICTFDPCHSSDKEDPEYATSLICEWFQMAGKEGLYGFLQSWTAMWLCWVVSTKLINEPDPWQQ